jgi:hypothetical protein
VADYISRIDEFIAAESESVQRYIRQALKTHKDRNEEV